MAIQNTGGAEVELTYGGKTSSGPARGVYHIKVVEHEKGMSQGDPNAVDKKTGKKKPKPPRPFLGLALEVTKKDKFHPSKVGKKLLTDKTYFAVASDETDKREMMAGMVKRKLFDGFGIPWSKDAKKLTGQLFIDKEAYVWVDLGKDEGDGTERRTQIQAISQDITKLPKAALAWVEEAKANGASASEEAVESTEEAIDEAPAAAAPARRR